MLLDLIELTTASIYLTSLSSREITTLSHHPTRGLTSNKPDGTKVTTADLRSQHIITSGLRLKFGGSPSCPRIVGEEDKSSGIDSNPNPNSDIFSDIDIANIFSDTSLYSSIKTEITKRTPPSPSFNTLYDASKLSIFIDPLDGTKHYAEGSWDEVTTLIGITYENTPILGICARPFTPSSVGVDAHECPFTIYGGVGVNGAYTLGAEGGAGERERERESESESESESISESISESECQTKFFAPFPLNEHPVLTNSVNCSLLASPRLQSQQGQ